jgi:hypothetical protein
VPDALQQSPRLQALSTRTSTRAHTHKHTRTRATCTHATHAGLQAHLELVRRHLLAMRDALALASILNRTLVLSTLLSP